MTTKHFLFQKFIKTACIYQSLFFFMTIAPWVQIILQTHVQIHTFYNNWANSHMLIGWELRLIIVKTKEILVLNQSLPSVSDCIFLHIFKIKSDWGYIISAIMALNWGDKNSKTVIGWPKGSHDDLIELHNHLIKVFII